jgi:hypothetical protein
MSRTVHTVSQGQSGPCRLRHGIQHSTAQHAHRSVVLNAAPDTGEHPQKSLTKPRVRRRVGSARTLAIHASSPHFPPSAGNTTQGRRNVSHYITRWRGPHGCPTPTAYNTIHTVLGHDDGRVARLLRVVEVERRADIVLGVVNLEQPSRLPAGKQTSERPPLVNQLLARRSNLTCRPNTAGLCASCKRWRGVLPVQCGMRPHAPRLLLRASHPYPLAMLYGSSVSRRSPSASLSTVMVCVWAE